MARSDVQLHRYDAIYGGLLDVFEEFDANKDGNISWKEFGQIIRAFDSKYTLHLTDKEIVTLFREADLDHSGSINFKCVTPADGLCMLLPKPRLVVICMWR